MTGRSRILISGTVAGFVLLTSNGLAEGQDRIVRELYGQGVHAYFAGDSETALVRLNSAIEQGNRDARCYYFRGLAHDMLGNSESAQSDFQTGALREAQNPNASPIGRSLERIQGTIRLQLEAERQAARVAVHNQRKLIEQVRYEEFQQGEKQVLQPTDPRKLVPPDLPATDDSGDDPFNADDGGLPLGSGPVEKAPSRDSDNAGIDQPKQNPPEPANVDPLGKGNPDPFDDTGDAPAEPAADPSGKEGGTPADDPFAEEGLEAEEDPFGKTEDTPAEDPFGEDGDTPAENPFEDPFGEDGDTPAEDPFEDPFGEDGDTSAENPQGADPFGKVEGNGTTNNPSGPADGDVNNPRGKRPARAKATPRRSDRRRPATGPGKRN